MGVETQALRWFQQVADGTTVTEVSELDQVSQPGVSRALARLEAEVGTPLLRRSGRTLRMTRAGAAFKRHVDAMLHELDDGLAAISELASPDSGTISVAFQPSLGLWLVPRLVASFHRQHPDVHFVLEQVRDELVDPLASGREVDLVITTVRSAHEWVRWRALVAEPLLLAVSATHPLAARDSVELREVAAEPFVMLRRTFALRHGSEDLCREAGFVPTIAFEGDDLPTVEGFVAAGLGVAIVPLARRRPGAGTDSDIRYLTITEPAAAREIGIAWSTERRLLPAAERFRRHVIDEARARSF
jgi:LysR family transcriptional activator of glutamate synthase operon